MAVIRNVQVADPGVGFDLDLSQELVGGNSLPNLSVAVSISNMQVVNGPTYTSSVLLNSPITSVNNNTTLVFVVPFGDSAYQGGQVLSVNITVVVPATSPNPIASFAQNVTASSGVFNYNISTALRILARALGLS